ncbi:MAG: anhydro-N-acetylmuramic acid kinase [Planctomycetota bacterium]
MAAASTNPSPRVRHVVGCMTGTSLDGLDVALARITGVGLDMTAEHLGLVSVPLPDGLRDTLRSLAEGGARPPLDVLRTARHLGVVHAEAVAELLRRHPDTAVDFVVAHGQTIWHAPGDALSWQLFDPWPIVRALGLPVCYDLRQADLVAGGQGAPVTPIADPILFPGPNTLVVNLGGIVNVTFWDDGTEFPAHRPLAYDLCPGNLLLDGITRRLFSQPMDRDGRHAAAGQTDSQVRHHLNNTLPILGPGEGSLGQQHCDEITIKRLTEAFTTVPPANLLRSAVTFVAESIGETVEGLVPDRVVLAGGGANNPTLTEAIRHSADAAVTRSDELGVPAEAREAVAFAVLGALSQDGVPITLPGVTGAKDPGVAGAWAYPDGPTGR